MLQVNEKIQRTLALIFSQEFEIPIEFFLTVTRVDCAPDLKNAKVLLSVLPFNKSKDALLYLIHNRKEIQRLLGKRVNLKYTPILKFVIDEQTQKADEIYTTLDSLK